MRPGTPTLLAKAERAANAAAVALEGGAPDAAAARAFYAMLYGAKVLLNERGIRWRAHRRIAAGLARVTVGESMPLHEWLTAAIDSRRAAGDELSYEDAREFVTRAQQFVAVVRRRL